MEFDIVEEYIAGVTEMILQLLKTRKLLKKLNAYRF